MTSLLATIAPTHTMLATAASRAAESSSSSALCIPHSALPPDPIRKYVIVADPITGAEQPIVFARHIQHNTVVPRGLKPVSAGFLLIYGGRIQIAEGFDSESLHLGPRPQDKALITAFLS